MSDLLLHPTSDHHSDTDPFGDLHLYSAADTPLHEQAFALSDEEKVERISAHFARIMDLLGLDLADDSLRGTPRRVAKMYVNEI
ncbi:MAG TPA: GTP cyclohydrolase I FolE, partial [Saprospiraceae bacterium]|nr:GTP cyclohydrolase I FolE [Saprospiraceae bacterium]